LESYNFEELLTKNNFTEENGSSLSYLNSLMFNNDFNDTSYLSNLYPEEKYDFETIDFCNQRVRLNYKVQYILKKYTTDSKARKGIQNLIYKAQYYEKTIKNILQNEGLPLDLFYVCVHESGLNARAVSHKGAKGWWQFIDETGRRYNLKTIYPIQYDERNDLEKSTKAACDYLRYLYYSSEYRFYDWLLALAAYNCGPQTVRYAIIYKNGIKDFWQLDRLPLETKNYIPQILAFKIIYENIERYNFMKGYITPYTYDLVKINPPVKLDLYKISSWLDVSFEKINSYNPHITNKLPVGIDCNIYLPAKTKKIFLSKYNNYIQNYANTADLNISISNKNNKDYFYEAQIGDTLESISERFNVDISDIYYWDNKEKRWLQRIYNKNNLYKGEFLKIKS